jgi:hypothetical protein
MEGSRSRLIHGGGLLNFTDSWSLTWSLFTIQLWTPDVENEPIARFQKALPAVNDRKAQLTLGDRAMEVQDLVVISFLFLEKENRIRGQ